MIKVVIVEDDSECRGQMSAYLDRYAAANSLEIEKEFYSDGLDFASDYRADGDIVLLDIDMPHMNGMDAARRIREFDETVAIVFITNMAHYAINGYEVNATDFIVKPVAYGTFAVKMANVFKLLRYRAENEIVVSNRNNLVRLPVSRILYVIKNRNDIVYHTAEGEYAERGSMHDAVEKLKWCGFALCASGCLVNLRHLTRTTQECVYIGDIQLWISRRMRKSFFDALMDYMGR